MKYLSVCSGIEAATVAWHPLGWTPVAFSEIEPFPSAVLAHRYPEVPNLGDMTKYCEWSEELLAEVDLLVGGTPCQAFSVAGLRRSLEDERGNLSLVFVKLMDAIDEQRKRLGKPPAVCVWENVPGVISTKDNAFGCFLAGLAGEGVPLEPPGGRWSNAGCVLGPERAVAWRVLDAQYFGLAQRRRRVFLVASARGDFSPAEVLLESEGVRRDTPPSRAAGQDTSGSTGDGVARRVTAGEMKRQDWETCNMIAGPIAGCSNGGVANGPGRTADDADSLVLVPTPFDTTQITSASNYSRPKPGDPCHPLAAGAHPPAIAVAFTQNSRDEVRQINGDGHIASALSAEGGSHQTNYIAFANRTRDGIKVPEVMKDGVTPALTNPGDGGRSDAVNVVVPRPMAFTTEQTPKFSSDRALTITKQSPTGGGQPQCVMTPMAVRRLTPRECERLQGFPDDYTAITYRGKPAADGPRYKALGNSMAVPVMAWIGRRIQQATEERIT